MSTGGFMANMNASVQQNRRLLRNRQNIFRESSRQSGISQEPKPYKFRKYDPNVGNRLIIRLRIKRHKEKARAIILTSIVVIVAIPILWKVYEVVSYYY